MADLWFCLSVFSPLACCLESVGVGINLYLIVVLVGKGTWMAMHGQPSSDQLQSGSYTHADFSTLFQVDYDYSQFRMAAYNIMHH